MLNIVLSLLASQSQVEPIYFVGGPAIERKVEDIPQLFSEFIENQSEVRKVEDDLLLLRSNGAIYCIDSEALGLKYLNNLIGVMQKILQDQSHIQQGSAKMPEEFQDYFRPMALLPFVKIPVESVSSIQMTANCELTVSDIDGNTESLQIAGRSPRNEELNWSNFNPNAKMKVQHLPPFTPQSIDLRTIRTGSRSGEYFERFREIILLLNIEYETIKSQYNSNIISVRDALLGSFETPITLTQGDQGMRISQLSAEERKQALTLLGSHGHSPEYWGSGKIEKVVKTVSITGKMKMKDGSYQSYEYILPAKLP